MDTVQQQLLHCLAAYARGEDHTPIIPGFDRWDDLLTLAGHHKLEAVIYGTLGRTPGFCGGDPKKAPNGGSGPTPWSCSKTARPPRCCGWPRR